MLAARRAGSNLEMPSFSSSYAQTLADGPITMTAPSGHHLGVVLVDDWSARDIRRFECEPLGPLAGRSFATSMSAWITPLDALAAARSAPPPQEPAPARYLQADDPWLLDVGLEVELNGELISRPPARGSWTPAQMLAHLTVNGAALSAGDLFATGRSAAPIRNRGLAGRDRPRRALAGGRRQGRVSRRAGAIEICEVRGRVVAA